APRPHPAASGPTRQSAQYLRARAAALAEHPVAPPATPSGTEVVIAAAPSSAHTGETHWSYEGAEGPQVWSRLNPAFKLCAYGLRQSPIAIDDNASLQGPAEALQFGYTPSTGTVVNNGHTIQVDVQGDNTLRVRGSTYQLRQFHFHTPAEEVVNGRRADMVVHLVHQNAEGQLAVVAVQLVAGEPNTLIDTVWTYMPLDTGDHVRIPAGLLNLGELLPTDQRYYQYMGSLTTPPCTEGVLWMVLKQPVTVSPSQLRLFTQIYANNARPVQPVNGRPVRDAQ
ncbi:MAG: carbonic anhydrase family protein, partial [Rhodoferax sp.]